MKEIYFDNSATTRINAAALRRMEEAVGVYGNPSSLHSAGAKAAALLASCREEIGGALGFSNGKLIFTAGGSEANNLALTGVSMAKKRYRGGKIVISAAEHPSVLKTAAFLESLGFRAARIAAPGGAFDFDAFEKELTDDVFLVSVMLVNNEIGYINDINRIYELTKSRTGALVHTDAVQGFSLVRGIKADLISVSGHKIGAPKGVGALCVSESVIKSRGIAPIIHGGEQESGLRAGTENIVGIAGFAGAASYLSENGDRINAAAKSLNARIRSGLAPESGIVIRTPEDNSVPSILNLSVGSIRAETLMNYLSAEGIMISAGSACSSRSRELSPALRSFGLKEPEARTAVRISIGEENTPEEADALTAALKSALRSLRGA